MTVYVVSFSLATGAQGMATTSGGIYGVYGSKESAQAALIEASKRSLTIAMEDMDNDERLLKELSIVGDPENGYPSYQLRYFNKYSEYIHIYIRLDEIDTKA